MSRKHLFWAIVLIAVMSIVVAGCAQEAGCDNPFLGSCQFDGNGIPPDFFSDVHVRRAFNYCFDWDTFVRDAWSNEAIQNVGYLIPGMVGYEQDGRKYTYNLGMCEAELRLAWDGK